MKKMYAKRFLSVMLCFSMLVSFFMPFGEVLAAELKSEVVKNKVNEFPKSKKEKTELVSKRTENKREYFNPDGTVTVDVYSKPIFWRDNSGKLNEINNDIVDDKKEKFELANNSNKFKIRFKKETDSLNSITKIELGDNQIEFIPIEPSKVIGVNNKNQISYKEIYPHVDFNYYSVSDGLKEDIVLKNKQAQNEFVFELKTNLNPKLNKNNVVEFYNENDEVVFKTTKPYAIDGNNEVTEDVKVELVKESEKWLLKTTLNNDWLQEEKRKFPVIIDPTVAVQEIDKDVIDAFVASGTNYSSLNFNDRNYLKTGLDSAGINRTYIDFDLPSLYSGAEVTSATLYLDNKDTDVANNTTVDVHRVTDYWNESLVTWNNKPNYNSTTLDSKTYSTSVGTWSFNVTNTVKDWYNGIQPNYGFLLKAKDETNNSVRLFNSAEYGVKEKNPKLSVTYKLEPMGAESFWNFDNGVNTHNGNFVSTSVDVSIPGRGVPINIARTFNSRSKLNPSGLGEGWQWNLDMRLLYSDPIASKIITFIDDDGTNHIFTFDGNKWVAPKGIQLELTYDSTNKKFTMTDTSKTKYLFNVNGKIETITDSNNNVTKITYDTQNRLKDVTDVSERVVTFDYSTPEWIKVSNLELSYDVEYHINPISGMLDLVQKVDKSVEKNVLGKVSYVYGANNLLNNIVEYSGKENIIGYNANERVDHFKQYQTKLDGTKQELITKYTYNFDLNTEGTITTKTNPKGQVSRFITNGIGNLTKEEHDYAFVNGQDTSSTNTDYVWNQENQLISTTDARGNSTTFSYDKNGNPEEILDSRNQKILMKYDSNHNVTQATGFAGETLKGYYDEKNNQTTSVDPSSSASITEYDSNGNVMKSSEPISLAYNLLLNSGFEGWTSTIPESWLDFTEGRSGSITKSTGDKKNGYNSLKITSTGSTDIGKVISTTIEIQPNTKYNLSWFVKATHTTNAKVFIRWYSDMNTLIGDSEQTNPENNNSNSKHTYDKWVRKSNQVLSPSNANYAKVYIEVQGGNALFDNIQFQEAGYVNDYNVLTNGGFENEQNKDGKPDNWYLINSTDSNISVDNTQKNTLFDTNSKNSLLIKGSTGSKYVSQTIKIPGEKNDSITFSGFNKTNGINTSGGDISLRLTFNYTDGTLGEFMVPFQKNNHDWQYIEKTVKAAKDYSSYAIFVHTENQYGDIWFDDVMARQIITNNAMLSEYNLAQNASFELITNGVIDSWSTSIEPNKSATVYRVYNQENNQEKSFIGKYAMRVSDTTGYVTISNTNTEPIVAGKSYTFSAMAKPEKVTSGGAKLGIRYYDNNGNILDTTYSSPNKIISGDKNWEKYSVNIDTDEILKSYPTATKFKVLFDVVSNTNGKIYFDAVRVEERSIFTEYKYDSKGNYVTEEKDANGNVTTYALDELGKVKKINYPKIGSFAEFEYDKLGRMILSKDSSNLLVKYTNDDKTGNVDNVSYFDSTDLSQTVLAQTSQTYNEFGEVLTYTDQLKNVTKYERNELGDVTTIYYPNGNKVRYGYDNLNRLKYVYYNDDTLATWEFQYDKNGNVINTIKSGVERTENIIDAKINQPTQITYPSGYKQNIGYNPSGKIASIKSSNLFVNGVSKNIEFKYFYYNSGSPYKTVGNENQTSIITTDEANHQAKVHSMISSSDTNKGYNNYFDFNDSGFLDQMYIERGNGGLLYSQNFQYDANGNITRINYLNGSYSVYTYDNANRLIDEKFYDATPKLAYENHYNYDVFGNRTSMTKKNYNVNLNQTINYSYNDANELISEDGKNYTYDQNGNTLIDKNYRYGYNAENQLITVSNSSGSKIVDYRYDRDGKRSKKIFPNGEIEQYYYNGDELTHITDGSDNLKYSFLRNQLGQLYAFVDYTASTPKSYYYVLNYRDDVIGLMDGDNWVASYQYDSFGNIIGIDGSAVLGNGKLLKDVNPFRYASYFYDNETKNYYLENRYYNAEVGRFLSRDDIENVNLYVYSENNPMNFTDSDGLAKKTLWQKIKSKAKKIKKAIKKKITSFSKSKAAEVAKNAYYNTSTAEKALASSVLMLPNTYLASKAKVKAENYTKEKYGNAFVDDDESNAYKHQVFVSLMVNDTKNAAYAFIESYFHELIPERHTDEGKKKYNMDMTNNVIGTLTGMRNLFASDDEIAEEVYENVKSNNALFYPNGLDKPSNRMK